MVRNRRSTRKDLNIPVKGTVKIHKFKNEYISDHNAFIQVENISLNGLRFSSRLKFPVTKELTVSMDFEIFGMKNQLVGTLAWKRKEMTNYVYGVEIVSANMGYIQSVASLTKPDYKVTSGEQ
ncbi:PilZ domain-containing protein [Domibacillus epiphyticus]|uniref:PilZ domain-containing protein n=1 Tax=Domibacillus epiphyticus TaxID=1714355 RepID=A0A1V2A3S5_9BACI|nr:PilZ domain-containing protein [Domibacillus epiphyticus]OMP65643.1 hypothetical protein BTO28_16305 [Domibacillus epiphyticus]